MLTLLIIGHLLAGQVIEVRFRSLVLHENHFFFRRESISDLLLGNHPQVVSESDLVNHVVWLVRGRF